MRPMIGLSASVLVVTALTGLSFSVEKVVTAHMKPVESTIVAKGLATYDSAAAQQNGKPWFLAEVLVSPQSFKKLGVDANKLGSAVVVLELSSRGIRQPMTLAPRRVILPQDAVWGISVAGANAPKMTVGEKVCVYINGKMALRGVAQ